MLASSCEVNFVKNQSAVFAEAEEPPAANVKD
jgi:hypothetical protein